MRVLVACEFSGIVRDAFARRGHDAWSCDLLPTENNGFGVKHYRGDVLDHIHEGWDLMIAHPPCTYLSNSGVRWLYKGGRGKERNEERWAKLNEAVAFFRILLNCRIERICIENPVPHKYGISEKPDQVIQPWMFGHGETKATFLWLKNLPLLKPTNIVEGRDGRVWREPPGPNRWKNRSRTYQGIADAMASQWG